MVPTGVIKRLLQLPCDRTGLPVTGVGSPQLLPAKSDHIQPDLSKDPLPPGGLPIIADVGAQQAKKITSSEGFLRVNLFKGNCLPAVTIIDAMPGFMMNMNDLRLGHIPDAMPLGLRPTCPGKILQTGQQFIVWMILPKGSADGSICIVTEGMRLVYLRFIGEPLAKNLVLRKMRIGSTALFSIR